MHVKACTSFRRDSTSGIHKRQNKVFPQHSLTYRVAQLHGRVFSVSIRQHQELPGRVNLEETRGLCSQRAAGCRLPALPVQPPQPYWRGGPLPGRSDRYSRLPPYSRDLPAAAASLRTGAAAPGMATQSPHKAPGRSASRGKALPRATRQPRHTPTTPPFTPTQGQQWPPSRPRTFSTRPTKQTGWPMNCARWLVAMRCRGNSWTSPMATHLPALRGRKWRRYPGSARILGRGRRGIAARLPFRPTRPGRGGGGWWVAAVSGGGAVGDGGVGVAAV